MAPDDNDYHKGTWSDGNILEAKAGNSQFESMYNELVEQTEGIYITVSE